MKEPPSALLVESYYRPAVARAQVAVFDHEMWAHCAHGLMLERQGIVGREAISACLRTVLELAAQGPESVPVDHRSEDLYSYVERRIVQALGPDVGGRLHTGRSRNDLNATTWRMALRGDMIAAQRALLGLRGTLLRLAEEHAAVVMPGYTHSQHAQPVTFGYWLLAAADVLARDQTRLAGALAHTDRCPLGAGALTTTAFPLDRVLTAELLGFPGPLEIAYDAVSTHDDGLEACAALAVLATFLSRLATDLISWSTWEYGFLEMADRHSAVSSIMPQKKNPAALEHVRAAAGMIQGALTAALACNKNTALRRCGRRRDRGERADPGRGAADAADPGGDGGGLRRPDPAAGAHGARRGRRLRQRDRTGRRHRARERDVLPHGAQRGGAGGAGRAGGRAAGRRHPQRRSRPRRHHAVRQAAWASRRRRWRRRWTRQRISGPATVLGGPAPAEMARLLAARREALARDAAAVEAIARRIAAARDRCLGEARALAG